MMETSSPLAAMQLPSFHYGYKMDRAPGFTSHLRAPTSYGPEAFNFRDLSMHREQPLESSGMDYFNMAKPVRGSSPTASLAADLSQNMHIDQSPDIILPTPRRALFVSGYLQARGDLVTTPPVASSSPGIIDGMEMDIETSPLPHKVPYSSLEIQLQSPTPDETPTDGSSNFMSPPTSDALSPDQLYPPVEKKKPTPRRPSLTRTKGLSTGCIPQAIHPESQLAPFRFGNYASKPAPMTLEQIFESSPVQERRRPSPVLPFARPRAPLGSATGSARGSPVGQHFRKASNPAVRPRKLSRRSLSMYEHPEDVMNQDQESPPPLPPIIDMDLQRKRPQLPHFSSDQVGELPRITKETMINVLDGQYDHMYEKRVIIDCRFEYEFLGGHIDGAVNFNDKEKLATQLLEVEPTSNALLIFHCEYSAHRAPLVAKFIRHRDRAVNAHRYPALTYPEVYILDGGYSSFYKDHRGRCFPQNYVEMEAKEHELACERGMGKVKQRSKLMRAQTFAFGQHSSALDSSPTAMGRSRLDSDDMELGFDYTPAQTCRPTLASLRGGAIRQFSY